MTALSRLTIEHLRGSVAPFTLSFEKGKKLTVVYGENGTGKTTICDALEFIGKGKVGSLEGRGLGNPGSYWPSLGKSAGDVSVRLDAGATTCTAKMRNRTVTATPPEYRPRVEVLRKNQIAQLLEAKPGERYAAIERFIDIAGIEASEESLRTLINDLKSNRDTAVAIVAENQTAILQFWESAGKPGAKALSWAKAEVLPNRSLVEAMTITLGELCTAFQRLSDYPKRSEALIAARDAASANATKAESLLQDALGNTAAEAGELVGILETALPYLAKHPDPKHCPLCESSENIANLRLAVEQRLQQFTALQEVRNNKANADATLRSAEEKLANLQSDLIHDGKCFEALRAQHTWEDVITLSSTPPPAKLDTIAQWITENAQLLASWRSIESARRDHEKFIGTLKKALETYEANLVRQKELDLLLPRLNRAHDIMREERRRFTDEILSTIAAEVGRLYESIHPGEGLEKISLELDPNKRASLEIGARFAGKNAPPQAYFSQSHLDTLGLCVFFALASMDDPGSTILVLDDILTSVDEPHVERLIEMLYTETAQFRHCIITTHYRPWREKFRWGWLKNGQCHFVELAKWTLDSGIQHVQSLADIERLTALLKETPPDPQLVCSKAGVALEAALNFLTERYECAVPRKPHAQYTLGDLLPAIHKKLRAALKVDVLGTAPDMARTHTTIALGPMLDELERIALVRNVFGAHFNALSFALLDADAIRFGTQVQSLLAALTCRVEGWPCSSKSGSYWATAGETRCLHPLRKPT